MAKLKRPDDPQVNPQMTPNDPEMTLPTYGTVRYGTVRYGTVHTVRYGTVRYSTVRDGTVRYGTVQYGTARGSTVQYGTARGNTIGYGTVSLSRAPQEEGHGGQEGALGGGDTPEDKGKEARLLGKTCDKLESDVFRLGIRVFLSKRRL